MLVVGNWKMNTGRQEAVSLAAAAAALADEVAPAVEVVLLPPFPWLDPVGRVLAGSRAVLGAQNLHAEENGAFTGEVSGAMLADAGCRYVVVGHSERRHLMGEDDAIVAAKVARAQRSGLRPILCVGETLDEREAGREREVVERQVAAGLERADLSRGIVIAYEPVWAIGTGRTATPEQAQEMHALIRGRLSGTDAAGDARILYGGSVKPSNAAELFTRPDVDGGLIGGASLDAGDFDAIVRAAGAAR
jgi:triosephosphate isomerase